MQPEESEHEMTQQASGGGGGVPTQGTNERANAEATTTTTYESEPPLASDNPSALPSNAGALLPGELWGTQGLVRDAVRAAEAEWRGLDPEAPLLAPMDRGREFFGTRYVMLACVERSLERRGVEPFLVRMELQSIIRYVASLERDCEEWCAYHFPFMPEDAGPRTRPHLERLAEQANL
jgi:hypothetical protein